MPVEREVVILELLREIDACCRQIKAGYIITHIGEQCAVPAAPACYIQHFAAGRWLQVIDQLQYTGTGVLFVAFEIQAVIEGRIKPLPIPFGRTCLNHYQIF